MGLLARDRVRLEALGRKRGTALQIFHAIQRNPYFTVQALSAATKISKPTVMLGVRQLVSMGMVSEVTGKLRNQVFVYREYLAMLDEGTELGR
jgi:predicted transcriptional regulator